MEQSFQQLERCLGKALPKCRLCSLDLVNFESYVLNMVAVL